MIVDTSAMVAMLIEEPEALPFAELILRHSSSISAGNWIELAAVITRRFPAIPKDQPELLRRKLDLVIAPVTTDQGVLGRLAYQEFGIGSKHRARLNFGDCFAYALSKDTGEPLLFKGDNFKHTDIVPALT